MSPISTSVELLTLADVPSDLDGLRALARRSRHDEIVSVRGPLELSTRTALTAGGTNTGAEFVSSHEAGLPNLSAASVPLVARARVLPGSAAMVGAWGFATRPAAETLAEGSTATYTSATIDASNITPMHVVAGSAFSRQFSRQSGADQLIEGELMAACWRRVEFELGSRLATDARVASTSSALTTTVLDGELEAALAEVPAERLAVMSSPAGVNTLRALATTTYPITWRQANGWPILASPGIPTNLGGGTDETIVAVGDAGALGLFTWGTVMIRDVYSLKKQGLVEMQLSMYVAPVILRPWLLRRITAVAT